MSKTTDIHAELDARDAPTTSKLPEWPEKAKTDGYHPADEWRIYWMETTAAALARMEALVAFIQSNYHGIRFR